MIRLHRGRKIFLAGIIMVTISAVVILGIAFNFSRLDGPWNVKSIQTQFGGPALLNIQGNVVYLSNLDWIKDNRFVVGKLEIDQVGHHILTLGNGKSCTRYIVRNFFIFCRLSLSPEERRSKNIADEWMWRSWHK